MYIYFAVTIFRVIAYTYSILSNKKLHIHNDFYIMVPQHIPDSTKLTGVALQLNVGTILSKHFYSVFEHRGESGINY